MTIARVLRPALAVVFAACALCAQAAPSERIQLCKGTPPARPDEMILVDSAFRRMPDRILRLGTIKEGSNPGDPALAAAPATVAGTLRRSPP